MARNIEDSVMPREGNNNPVNHGSWSIIEEKSITFAGGTTNAIGDHDGTGDPFNIFTVTGTVMVRVFGVCTTLLAGASSTLEVGITGNTAGLIAQTTGTDIDAGNIWHDASPDAGIELATVAPEEIISNGSDIIGTVGTANITSGVIKFYCAWYPISPDGLVEAA